MKEIHTIFRKISFNLYTTFGNHPKTINELFSLENSSINYDQLQNEIDKNINDGFFFLDKLPCGRYIKSYRINEVCYRTLEVLENKIDNRIYRIIKKNPKILYIEFNRWLSTKHSNMMSSIIDEFWHQFITFSYEYKSWCMDNFGRFIHHIPTPKYAKDEVSSEDIINDNIMYFKSYLEKYVLTENVLLYSLPLRLYVNEGKTENDIFHIISILSCNSTSTSIEKWDTDVEINKELIKDDINKKGFSIIKNTNQILFCELMESLGEVINVSDIKINNLSNRKFNHYKGLELHTDTPQAKFVAWYCIEQDEIGGDSIFVDINDILFKLSSEDKLDLMNIYIKYPIFKKSFNRDHPILSFKDSKINLYYTPWLKKNDYDEKQMIVMEKFEHLIRSVKPYKVRLHPGDALILDNTRMLHGRGNISCTSNRYLYRVHIGFDNVEAL